ncbi:MAG: anti-sigma factor [Burkholderiales bacterium]|nr:anti-sigma factor [Burkholderiales bacterium]
MTRPPPKYRPMSEQDLLHAYVDHQLDDADAALVEATLGRDDAARSAVADWQKQNEQLRALELEALAEPVPLALLAAARKRRHAGWLGGELWPQALAASVLLGLGLAGGWMGHGAWSTQAQPADTQSLARGLMRDAMVAHVVYAADTRRPVEVVASEQDQLLRWLSRRLGRPLKLPALTELGWSLVGGRLLPGDTGGASATRAQFMYEDRSGQRLTLYLSVIDQVASGASGGTGSASTAAGAAPDHDDTPSDLTGHTAFSFASRDNTRSFYWTEGSFGYALVGELPRETLARLSSEVYQQTIGATQASGVKR